MQGNKAKQGSRLRNYQTSDDQDEPHSHNPNDFHQADNEDPDQIEILFDPNEALAGFGNPSAGVNPITNAYGYEDDVEGEKMGSGDSSGFYEHEDALEQPMAEPKHFSSVQTPSDFPNDFEEPEREFNYGQNDDYQFETKPVVVPTYTQERDVPSSYVNYQISSAARAAHNKKKQPPIKNKPINKDTYSNKPEILSMGHDDIGEVGEWVGRSANVNAKNEDSEEEDEERNNSDDFEGVFEQTEPRVKKPSPAEAASYGKRSGDDDEEEEERGETYHAPTHATNLADQSNRAMQKAQDSALRAAKNKGPFMNNLKAKAKNLQIKTQEEVTGLVDGDVKLKNDMQKPTTFNEQEEAEDGEDGLDDYDIQNQKERFQQIQKPNIPKLEGLNGVMDKKVTQLNVAHNKFVEEDEQSQGLDEIMNRQSPEKMEQVSPVDEWEAISKMTAQQANQKISKDDTKLVTFNEAWNIVRHLNLAEQKAKVQQDLQGSQSFFQKIFGSCSGGGLSATLLDERDHVLALAKVPFSEDQPLYFDILKTLYITLTGKRESVPRFGPHWEVIGFQGRDPATDLRSVGVLGLIQLLAFICSNEKLFKKMFEHSIHDKYNFPLSICGLSITQSVMEVLRAGRLNSSINSKRSVIAAMNEVYFATFYKLYSIYATNSYTIQDYPKAKMVAVGLLKANPNALVNEYNKAMIQVTQEL